MSKNADRKANSDSSYYQTAPQVSDRGSGLVCSDLSVQKLRNMIRVNEILTCLV